MWRLYPVAPKFEMMVVSKMIKIIIDYSVIINYLKNDK